MDHLFSDKNRMTVASRILINIKRDIEKGAYNTPGHINVTGVLYILQLPDNELNVEREAFELILNDNAQDTDIKKLIKMHYKLSGRKPYA